MRPSSPKRRGAPRVPICQEADTYPGHDWTALDELFAARVEAAPPDRRWLLVQTLATAGSRRALLSGLPVRDGMRVLDLGCGFGASSLELASLRSVRVVGVDRDQPVLAVAAGVAREVLERGRLAPGSTASYVLGDAYRIPLPDHSVDAAVSRFVFQHLPDPEAAVEELRRVIRPGGLLCVEDVDDGLSLSEPPPSAEFERLSAALRAAQSAAGGDRHVGRRVPALLDGGGFNPDAVLVMPQAAYRRPAPGDPERALLLDRLRVARAAILSGGHMTPDQFERDLAALAGEEPGPTLDVQAHLVVLASRRP